MTKKPIPTKPTFLSTLTKEETEAYNISRVEAKNSTYPKEYEGGSPLTQSQTNEVLKSYDSSSRIAVLESSYCREDLILYLCEDSAEKGIRLNTTSDDKLNPYVNLEPYFSTRIQDDEHDTDQYIIYLIATMETKHDDGIGGCNEQTNLFIQRELYQFIKDKKQFKHWDRSTMLYFIKLHCQKLADYLAKHDKKLLNELTDYKQYDTH